MKARALALAALLAAAPGATAREPLLVDLAHDEVLIHAAFTGAEILLFGAVDGGGDVVVTVTGPPEDAAVRRKVRTGGVWLNGEKVVIPSVPSYYALAATRPLAAVAPAPLRRALGIGVESRVADVDGRAAGHRAGLIRAYLRRGLYPAGPSPVTVKDGALFRTTIRLPAETPTGDYVVETFLLRHGEVRGHRVNAVRVERAGFDAFVYDLAHRQPVLYGLLAIAVALLTGTAAAEAFRRV